MAKYQVTHACGHIKTHSLFGKNKDREWRIARLESEYCSDCVEAERQKQNQMNAQKNAEYGLPELEGSEKQIAWAETIRRDAVLNLEVFKKFIDEGQEFLKNSDDVNAKSIVRSFIDGMLSTIKAESDITIQKDVVRILEDDDSRKAQLNTSINKILLKNDAVFWIENRVNINSRIGAMMAESIIKYLKGDIKEVECDDENIESKILEMAAMQEATIYPEEEVECDDENIAIVRTTNEDNDVKKIIVEFARNRKIYDILRKMGFATTNKNNMCLIFNKEKHINMIDVVAEVIAKILESKHPVRCFDALARAKAINGDYTPYHKKWIDLDGEYFVIPHLNNDALYRKIRNIKGSKWDGRCLVPLDRYDDVLGFAKINDYRFTQDTQKTIDILIKISEQKILAPKNFSAKPDEQIQKAQSPIGINPELIDD